MNNSCNLRRFGGALILNLLGMVAAGAAEPAASVDDADAIARGRYIIAIAGCNDCHTAGYAQAGGQVPEDDWLTGDSIGFQGPWGVSYPANLRLSMNRLTEAQWVAMARAERLPPMPWFSLARMSDQDIRAIYAYVRSLGPKGEPTPVALKPGDPVTTPVIVFEPREPSSVASSDAVTSETFTAIANRQDPGSPSRSRRR